MTVPGSNFSKILGLVTTLMIMDEEKKEIKCKECHMIFYDLAHLERHMKYAHKSKHDGFVQKWYWEN